MPIASATLDTLGAALAAAVETPSVLLRAAAAVVGQPPEGAPAPAIVRLEAALDEAVLALVDEHSITEVAKQLGVSLRTLQYRRDLAKARKRCAT